MAYVRDTVIKVSGVTKIVRVQIGTAKRGGVSSMGTKYEKGNRIVHLSSSRDTGEVFILAGRDLVIDLARAFFDNRETRTPVANIKTGRKYKNMMKKREAATEAEYKRLRKLHRTVMKGSKWA